MQEGMDEYGEYSIMVMVMVILIVCVWVMVLVHSPYRTSLQEVSLSSVFIMIYIGVGRYIWKVLCQGHGHGHYHIVCLGHGLGPLSPPYLIARG